MQLIFVIYLSIYLSIYQKLAKTNMYLKSNMKENNSSKKLVNN